MNHPADLIACPWCYGHNPRMGLELVQGCDMPGHPNTYAHRHFYCQFCGHRYDLARILCDCLKCRAEDMVQLEALRGL